jgi:hypothetical protein
LTNIFTSSTVNGMQIRYSLINIVQLFLFSYHVENWIKNAFSDFFWWFPICLLFFFDRFAQPNQTLHRCNGTNRTNFIPDSPDSRKFIVRAEATRLHAALWFILFFLFFWFFTSFLFILQFLNPNKKIQ